MESAVYQMLGQCIFLLQWLNPPPYCTIITSVPTRSGPDKSRLEPELSNKSQAFCSLSRFDVLAAISVAAFVALLGLWPHLKFSSEIGELRYFHGAYDEDTYVLSWLLGTLRTTRALSGFALSAIHGLSARSLDMTLVVSDFVFPSLAAFAAYFAASQLVSSRSGRVSAALLLLFANDLFSLGNVVLWSSGRANIQVFTQLAGSLYPDLVPSYETSFLAIFRTPEPQVSFALMFLNLGLLARATSTEGIGGVASVVATIGGISLLPIGYTFVTFPVAAIAAALMLVLVYLRRPSAVAIAIGLMGATLTLLAALLLDNNGGQTTAGLATGLTYRTRLPIVTPAVIVSVVFGVPFGAWTLLRARHQPLCFLAFACLIAPLVLSNQQILTGSMFSARDWERSASYPLLVFGMIAALSVVAPFHGKWSGRLALVLWITSAIVVVVVWQAQRTAYAVWRPYNMQSIAIVRALQAVDADMLKRATLVFEDAGIATLMQARTAGGLSAVLTFYRVATNFIPNMVPEAGSADPSRYEADVFQHWFRGGVSPGQAKQLLRSEIKQRAGLHLNYLFSFRDAWYPASDNRAVRQADLERSVEPIIGRYQDYLASGARCAAFERPALLVSALPPGEIKSPPTIRNEPLAKGVAGGVEAYVYRQSSREVACAGRDTQ